MSTTLGGIATSIAAVARHNQASNIIWERSSFVSFVFWVNDSFSIKVIKR